VPTTVRSGAMTDRILVAEPDDSLRDAMCLRFNLEGYGCKPVADGEAALRCASSETFDLVVIGLAASLGHGSSTCRRLRESLSGPTPILLVANDANESEALLALEQYADDYMVRPVALREFVARSRALIRRAAMRVSPPLTTTALHSDELVIGPGLIIDRARRRVQANGRDVKLTEQEFQLLYRLAAHRGVVFGRDALLQHIWGSETFVTPRSVDALVKRVRRRLETVDASPHRLVTVRRVGYKFEDHASV
jgi:DNA-binding response OmpR family regulator